MLSLSQINYCDQFKRQFISHIKRSEVLGPQAIAMVSIKSWHQFLHGNRKHSKPPELTMILQPGERCGAARVSSGGRRTKRALLPPSKPFEPPKSGAARPGPTWFESAGAFSIRFDAQAHSELQYNPQIIPSCWIVRCHGKSH